MKNFTFVILHYCNIDDTLKCVNSILKYKDNIDIVIVDNGSSNNTGNILKDKYKDNKNIHVIINDKNLGFSKGNNVGFIYAKQNLNPDYIIMINNDVVMIDKDFCNKIDDNYNNYKFDVLGPKIMLPNNEEYIYEGKLPSITKEIFIIIKIFIRLILNYTYLYGIIKKYKNKKKISNNKTSELTYNKVLHGSCLIFSKNYINKFDGIVDKTFLYCEEELLYLRIKKNKMLSLYNPDITILHNEDGATNYIYKNNRKRNIFRDKQLLKSNFILLKELIK